MPSNDELQRRARATIRQIVTQWTPGLKPRWTIAEVRHALRLHAQGDFSRSALLVDTMGEDDAIPGLLEKLTDSVLKNEFTLEPVEKPNRQLSKRIATELGAEWWDMYPESELDELLRWYEMLGVAIAVQDIEHGGNAWRPRLRVLHPQFLYRDETLRKWFYNAQEGLLEVEPGNGTWILLTDGQRGWMRGKVRSAAIPWIGKQLTIRDQGRWNERHGFPIVKARVPAIADEGDRDDFWEDLKSLANETTVELLTHVDGSSPEARYDLDLLEAKDTSGPDGFEKTLNRWDRRLTILFLGGNQSTEVDGKTGTQASSKQHADELEDKAKARAKKLETLLRKQGLWPVVALNYAAAVFEVTPWPHWDTDPPEDEKAAAEAKEAFGKAIKAVQDAGYDVDNVEELADRYGLKLTKRELPAPVPAPPGQEPAEDEDADDDEADPEVRGGVIALASGATAAGNRGFLEGQLYIDALVEKSAAHGAKTLQPDVKTVLDIIAEATDYDDLRTRLRAAFGGLDPEKLSSLLERTMVLAELAGRSATLQDL